MNHDHRNGCFNLLVHLTVSLPLAIVVGFLMTCRQLFVQSGAAGNIIQLIALIIFIVIFGWLGIVWYLIAYVAVGLLLTRPWKQ